MGRLGGRAITMKDENNDDAWDLQRHYTGSKLMAMLANSENLCDWCMYEEIPVENG